jgi:RNA polymerase sigma-70 factor (ECF subfamily)
MSDKPRGDASRADEFESVYREFVHDVRRYCAANVGRDEVDEVVNATFVTVWQRLHESSVQSRRAWVLGVARNHCRNKRRSAKRFASLVDQVVAARPRVERSLSEAGVSPETMSALTDAVNDLSADDRELLVLVGWLEMSPSEIAEVVGMPAGTVRVRLHRLRAWLGQRLGESDAEGGDPG